MQEVQVEIDVQLVQRVGQALQVERRAKEPDGQLEAQVLPLYSMPAVQTRQKILLQVRQWTPHGRQLAPEK
jgi:hypothetical protein